MQTEYRVAIIDDELPNLESLERVLKSDGATVFTCQAPEQALPLIQRENIDLVITDLRMPGMSGMELLEAIKLVEPTVEVVLITAFGTVEIAVDAMKKGAYDFITKPLQRIQVLKTVHKALEKRKLSVENALLRESFNQWNANGSREILGRSEKIKEVLTIANQAASSKASVLISGESGTGKGLLAEYLHRASQNPGLFVKINCAAIPENLLEAELFGYEPGAFTGATKRKKGRVELAHQGTLFLDEIGIAPISFQTKLLRFLQEGEFERLGSNETQKVETRVISATNADLAAMIRSQQFREDLYYRLNVIHVRLPALRERKEDIPLLVAQFLQESAKKNGRDFPGLHPDALECLVQHSWPGNIRELQNLIERLVVLNQSGMILTEDLPQEISREEGVLRFVNIPVGVPLREVERILLNEALKISKGDKKVAAKLLGVHLRTIYRHLETEEMAVA